MQITAHFEAHGTVYTIVADHTDLVKAAEQQLRTGIDPSPEGNVPAQTAPAASSPAPTAAPGGAASAATPTASTPPPAAAPAAAATPSPEATVPQETAPASATTTATPQPAANAVDGEKLVELASALLDREGGEEYLLWALNQVGAQTVGTTPPEKHGELADLINKGLEG